MKTRHKHQLAKAPLLLASADDGLQRVAASGIVALLTLVACGADGPGSDVDFQSIGQDIIGGVIARSSELDHTGALVLRLAGSDELIPFCTATLIGPETVVTAKHCAAPLPRIELGEGRLPAFAVGPDAASPSELIPIVEVHTAPGLIGGFVGMGRDVAVLHLEHPTAVEPATPRGLSADWVGAPMVSIGYGVHVAEPGPRSIDTHRRIGRQTIEATEGRAFEAMFGSFAGFLEAFDIPASELSADELAALRRQYEQLVLFDQHEAVTGLAEADSQTCFGDSGGPLLRPTASGWETYGVVSGGIASFRSQCDHGGVYATFGPDSLAFIEAQMAWSDPCGDVTPSGECDGSTARVCYTSLLGNIRRLEERDCAALGQECVSSDQGTGCGSVPAPAPQTSPSPEQREVLFEQLARAQRPSTMLATTLESVSRRLDAEP